ncbi:MAG: signal peptidase I [Elusimicrobia bacterium]|jgi:hypothetical protein|nr:MAG: signal peptidase I [Elusimicrobiota bacterium]
MQSGNGVFGLLVWLGILALLLVASWRVFVKAGRPGWASLVPFYNLYVLCEIVSWPGWYLVFFLIPIVNIIFMFLLYFKLSKAFGQGLGFAVGLVLLPFVFLPILGFGKAAYTAPAKGIV